MQNYGFCCLVFSAASRPSASSPNSSFLLFLPLDDATSISTSVSSNSSTVAAALLEALAGGATLTGAGKIQLLAAT